MTMSTVRTMAIGGPKGRANPHQKVATGKSSTRARTAPAGMPAQRSPPDRSLQAADGEEGKEQRDGAVDAVLFERPIAQDMASPKPVRQASAGSVHRNKYPLQDSNL